LISIDWYLKIPFPWMNPLSGWPSARHNGLVASFRVSATILKSHRLLNWAVFKLIMCNLFSVFPPGQLWLKTWSENSPSGRGWELSVLCRCTYQYCMPCDNSDLEVFPAFEKYESSTRHDSFQYDLTFSVQNAITKWVIKQLTFMNRFLGTCLVLVMEDWLWSCLTRTLFQLMNYASHCSVWKNTSYSILVSSFWGRRKDSSHCSQTAIIRP
jgi:hypothetical protein